MTASRNNLVSVIMPAYNCATTVEEAVRSVLAQTHPALELLLIDDASNDATADVVRNIEDDRIRVLRLQRNGGAGAARNAALDMAQGDWVTLIDSDDLWDSRRLELLLAAGQATQGECMIADDIIEFFDSASGRQYRQPIWKAQLGVSGFDETLSLARYLRLPRTVMQPLIPRQAIERHGLRYANLPAAEDFEFYIRLFKQAGLKLHVLDYPGYHYRMTPGSLSANPKRSLAVKSMLERLAGELQFDLAQAAAINARIDDLDRHIRYIPFLDAVRKRQAGVALGLAIRQPWFLVEFLRRLPGSLPYRLSVWRKGGQSR
jgi:succinoglycan biosynthesis protein ExoO